MRNLMVTKLCLVMLVVVAMLAACGGESSDGTQAEAGESAEAKVSFAGDVLPILKENCTRCHGSSRQSGGLQLHTYEAVVAGATGGAVVVPNEPADSRLVEVVITGEMPMGAAPLSQEEAALISDWVEAGALDN